MHTPPNPPKQRTRRDRLEAAAEVTFTPLPPEYYLIEAAGFTCLFVRLDGSQAVLTARSERRVGTDEPTERYHTATIKSDPEALDLLFVDTPKGEQMRQGLAAGVVRRVLGDMIGTEELQNVNPISFGQKGAVA